MNRKELFALPTEKLARFLVYTVETVENVYYTSAVLNGNLYGSFKAALEATIAELDREEEIQPQQKEEEKKEDENSITRFARVANDAGDDWEYNELPVPEDVPLNKVRRYLIEKHEQESLFGRDSWVISVIDLEKGIEFPYGKDDLPIKGCYSPIRRVKFERGALFSGSAFDIYAEE
jgi:hypothetical protein